MNKRTIRFTLYILLLAGMTLTCGQLPVGPTSTPTAALTPYFPTATTIEPMVIYPEAYYVSPKGDDSNPGTESQPWKTLGKAASQLSAGDVVYIRAGVYQESVIFYNSGTEEQSIKILAYPGETPVIDGDDHRLPATEWNALINLAGDYLEVSGLEVQNSKWMGVALYGQHDRATRLNVHHSQETGILASGDYSLVENCLVWWNAADHAYGGGSHQGGGWATGLSAARDLKDGVTDNAVLRGNVIFNNWGEGLSSFETRGTLIEGNIVYDNWLNTYISDSTGVVFQRNLIYCTPDNIAITGKNTQVGIGMGDEKYNPASRDIQISNNLVVGCNKNFYWWSGTQGGGMVNVLVAYNTLLDSVSETNLKISDGNHTNSKVMNNIISQTDTIPVAIVPTTNSLQFSHNLWSSQPPSSAFDSTDIIGDSKLARNSQIAPGLLTAEWFVILSDSPARNQALNIDEVPQDYFGAIRDTTPDIGAIEYSD